MTTRRKGDAQWRKMAEILHRHAQPLRMTLATAQQLVEAAPDEPLPREWVQAVVAQALARWSETRLACVPSGANELVFRAETWVCPTAGLVELPRLIGIDVRPSLGVAMTRIESDAVDVTAVAGRHLRGLGDSQVGPTESVVLDVVLDWRPLEGSRGRVLRQCTLRWDACLEAEAVDANRVSSHCDAWRDSTVPQELAPSRLERN